MNLKDHVEVARIENTRWALSEAAEIECRLNDAVGSDNVDWWIKEYYEAQCSYRIFTVPKELEDKARKYL